MRAQNMLLLVILISMIGVVESRAQNSQYQRPGKKKSGLTSGALVTPGATGQEPAKDSKDAGKGPSAQASSSNTTDKVDITDLEQKYWAPKDVEFSVVQNRLYSKTHRFAITPQIGPLVTDSFSSGTVLGLTGNYYFSERHGVELHYSQYNLQNSTVAQGFIESNGTNPDFNRQKYYVGASYNWVPIYAKISLLDQKIMYFDMSFSPGVGLMAYEQQKITKDGETKTTPALSLDVAQHYFLSKEFAFRVDMRNRFYKDEVIKYRSPYGVVNGERFNHSITIQFGITYYFGG